MTNGPFSGRSYARFLAYRPPYCLSHYTNQKRDLIEHTAAQKICMQITAHRIPHRKQFRYAFLSGRWCWFFFQQKNQNIVNSVRVRGRRMVWLHSKKVDRETTGRVCAGYVKVPLTWRPLHHHSFCCCFGFCIARVFELK